MIKFVLHARAGVGELVDSCARGELSFDDLCRRVAAMGFKTTSLYEMVREAEMHFQSPQEREEPQP